MDELINAMSNDDLKALKEKYADNASVATLIDGILEGRVKVEAEAKAKSQFASGIAKAFSKLPHPEDILNVYVRWAEVDEPVEGAEPAEVVVDGVPEMRQPTTKVFQWVVEVNKGFQVQKQANNTATISKRAITVYKRSGTNLEPKGHYASASKACEELELIGCPPDSGTRVLQRGGYIIEPYDGTDITS